MHIRAEQVQAKLHSYLKTSKQQLTNVTGFNLFVIQCYEVGIFIRIVNIKSCFFLLPGCIAQRVVVRLAGSSVHSANVRCI